MEEPEKTPLTQTAPKAKKAGTAMWPIIAVLLIAAGAGAYWWRDSQAKKQHKTDTATITSLQTQLKTATSKETTATPSLTEDPAVLKAAVVKLIKDSISSGNTAAIETYMAASVHVVIAASEGVFDHTPAEAISDLKYLDSATDPWDFALSAATLSGYASGDYKQYFKSDSVVGKSADGRLVSFNFDSSDKISGVFMSASADLL